ncbi:Alpha/Beta hydrolase protein [Radiomyces spectabilis]|uniref:Alpha/Beta hydrolase protein n=1 Tax=Radiomyces spectabilis TaxID=64574 RepID=UPI00221ED046|nr:Alpha/Beta hydrolase protein [Radiomyces spectabilis]KAI8393543.1 Alpha/Beta hydrolase protein [Radiomyces spectabilis]
MFKVGLPSWLSYALSVTGLAGLAGATFLYLYQCDLIYPSSFPEGSRTEVAKPSDYGLKYTEETLTTKDKVKLRSYIMTLENEAEAKAAPTILYFHANAGNMGHRLPIAKIFVQKYKYNVVMLSYRGYGFSEGKANEKGLRIDAQTMLDFVKNHPILKDTRLIAYGQSIGGAVAIDLVSRNEDVFSGLILENTFLSLPKMIPHVLPMLRYFTFLCHQQWPSEASVQRIVKTPVLFLAGARDELVPPSHMVKLHELCGTRDIKDWVIFERGMHNDTCMQPGYFTAIREFIEKRILKEERVDPQEEEKEKEKKTVAAVKIDGVETTDKRQTESYQLVSGVADAKGMTHSFQVEEIELEEEDEQ